MRIEVAGIPAPQGSKRHVGGGRMVEMSRAVGPWREAVRAETQRAVEAEILTHGTDWAQIGPVQILVQFRLRRPATVKRQYPVTRPDLDKLVRAVLDGITEGGAIADDSQVIQIAASKRYAKNGGAVPGCSILIRSM